ncbi:MAG: hypothetical protein AAGG69_02230 [Pseudomonadota bacterium]
MRHETQGRTHPTIDAIESLLDAGGVAHEQGERAAALLGAHIINMVPRDQRALCARLQTRDIIPDALISQMILSSIDGFEQYIVHAPHFSEKRAHLMIETHGAGPLTRALARRADNTVHVLRALRNLGDEGIDRAIELRQTGPVPDRIVEATLPVIDLQPKRKAIDAETYREFMRAAIETTPGLLATAISDGFDLPFQTVHETLELANHKNLASLFGYLGLSAHDAQRLLCSFGWRRYPDAKEREAFGLAFAATQLESENNGENNPLLSVA